MAQICVDALDIQFPLYHGDARSLKKSFLVSGNRFGQDQRQRIVVDGLKKISFSADSGERIGLVGRNGAGKTTLLRALAGIYEPVGGHVYLEGRLATLLDSSLGMNPELSGRENLRLRALYAGLSRVKTCALEEDVAFFSGLGRYFDLPMKAYSSGMGVRLAFAIATAPLMGAEILLMDEWLLAGDGLFLQQATQRLASLIKQAEILVLSTHQVSILRQWCTRLIWLENGIIKQDGPVGRVLGAYLEAH